MIIYNNIWLVWLDLEYFTQLNDMIMILEKNNLLNIYFFNYKIYNVQIKL